ncbi:N-6 DNA methylase [Erysipelotrichaceae bacterium 66-17]
MLTRERVNEIFGIKESYKLPDKIMDLIFHDPDYLYNSLKNEDMRVDFFRDYFQDEQGDRNALKQDFTPDSICEIVARIVKDHGHPQMIADMCAGTGALTIHMHKVFPDAEFFCYEISERTVPFLLLNMMIRNMSGWLIHGDLLTGKIQKVYKLEKGTHYSSITIEQEAPDMHFDAIVSNPPYSLKYDGEMHPDFEGYAIPPKSKADYAFVLHELAKLKPNGCLEMILPCGVLFRTAKEGEIREKLIRNGWLHSVIELPEKLFLNTGIPVVIMDIQQTDDGVYFVDAEKEYMAQKKQNIMEDKHIDHVMNAYDLRRNIEKFANLVSLEELEKHEFNCNISRHVDTFEAPEIPDMKEVLKQFVETEKEIERNKKEFFTLLKELSWTDGEKRPEWETSQKELEGLYS